MAYLGCALVKNNHRVKLFLTRNNMCFRISLRASEHRIPPCNHFEHTEIHLQWKDDGNIHLICLHSKHMHSRLVSKKTQTLSEKPYQGRAQKFEKGGAAISCLHVSTEYIGEDQKKKVFTSSHVQFIPPNQVKTKKEVNASSHVLFPLFR